MSDILVDIHKNISSPRERVAGYIEDFRNAREWMVGVENVEHTGAAEYKLALETPVGRLQPEAKVVEHRPGYIRWVYTSTIEGEGRVEVESDENRGCVVRYAGSFRLKGGILGRAAKAVGMEGFARRQGERSLDRLKHLMEARRY
ncbi:MAG: SRPBCC family protein [Rubrobacteraceae bacterium]